jgi:hypothetical protein
MRKDGKKEMRKGPRNRSAAGFLEIGWEETKVAV